MKSTRVTFTSYKGKKGRRLYHRHDDGVNLWKRTSFFGLYGIRVDYPRSSIIKAITTSNPCTEGSSGCNILMKVKIFLQKTKTILRGLRFQRLSFIFKGSSARILHQTKKAVHQHNRYHKTKINKFGVLPYFRLDSAFVKSWLFCYDLISTHSNYRCVLKSLSGVTYISPLIDSVGLGDRLRLYKNALRFYYFIKTGSVSALGFLKPGFMISNVGQTRALYATSMGTYCIVGTYKKHAVCVTLPSGFTKVVPIKTQAFIGRNAGIYRYKEYFGKAYLHRHVRHRVIVRSCAKNPVDHPNGGRTRGKKLIKSPWGKVARAGK